MDELGASGRGESAPPRHDFGAKIRSIFGYRNERKPIADHSIRARTPRFLGEVNSSSTPNGQILWDNLVIKVDGLAEIEIGKESEKPSSGPWATA